MYAFFKYYMTASDLKKGIVMKEYAYIQIRLPLGFFIFFNYSDFFYKNNLYICFKKIYGEQNLISCQPCRHVNVCSPLLKNNVEELHL